LIQHFKESGYYTYGAGKIFHRDDAVNEKWDEYYSNNSIPIPESLPAHGLQNLIEARGVSFDWQGINAPLESWGDYKTTVDAIDFMHKWKASNQNNLFLMILGYRFPHLPWYYPNQFKINLTDQNMPMDFIPENYTFISKTYEIIKDSGKWKEAVESYTSSINFIDYNIGLFLDSFFKLGYDENTILIVFSDHGYHLGEKGRWEKVTLWNESLISPLIVYIPELTTGKQYISDPVSLLDIYPTLIESCNLSKNKFIDGKSLINNIKGNNIDNNETFQTSITIRGGAIADKSYKYFYENNYEGFYNVLLDNNELHNLAYSTDNSLQKLKIQYSDLLTNVINSYKLFEVPKIPEQLTILEDSSQFIISWQTSSNDDLFFEIMLSDNSNFNKKTILRSDTNILILDKHAINKNYVRVRSLNPKYKSEWSPSFELNLSLRDILLKDPLITIFDFNGRVLNPPIRYSDNPDVLSIFSGGYYLFSFTFKDFTLNRKIYIQ
jgi:arylsulfatase A-like enzyme